MEKDNLLRSKRIYEKRLSEELQLKTISNTRGHHYSANYREWLHKEIKAIGLYEDLVWMQFEAEEREGK